MTDKTDLENAIAISAEFHTGLMFNEFYEKFCDDLHGFAGIYDLIAEMAKELTAFENSLGDCPWDDMPTGRDWIEFVEDFTNLLIAESLETGVVQRPKDIIDKLILDSPA